MQLRTATPRVPGTRRSLRTRMLAAVAALPLLIGPAALVSGAPAASAAEEGAVTVTLAPDNSGLSRPGEALVVSGTLANSGETPLSAGTVTISVAPQTVDEAGLRAGWADPASVDSLDLLTIDTPPLTVSGSVQLTATVPPEVVDAALAGTGWGAHVVLAEFSDGEAEAVSSSALVRLDGEAPAPLTVSVVLPMTAEPSTDGLLDAEELERLTGPAGLLTRRLAAASDPRTAIALDPRLVASIRVLGSSAPEDATAWLASVEALPNDVFPLQYGDADPGLQAGAGAGQPLAPTSFAAALDPADFTGTTATTVPTPTPTASTASPSPAPEDGETPAVPTTEEILAFPYTRTDLAWPGAGTVTGPYLDSSTAVGLTTSLVDSSQLDTVTGAVADLDGRRVLVSDAVSASVSEAVFSVGTAAGRLSTSRAAGLLAAAALRGDAAQPILIALDRGRATGTDVADRLTALQSLPWVDETTLDAAGAASPVRAALLPASDGRVAAAASLIQDESAINAFSSVLTQPELLTSTARLDLLATLSAGWVSDPSGWSLAVSEQQAETSAILNSITIDESSQVNVLSYSAGLPVNVSNALPYQVTVTVVPRASNGRLTISSNTVTVDPQSTGRVQLDAKPIANGRVSVDLQLRSPSFVPVGTGRTLQLELSPFVETAGIAILAALVLGLLGFGTFRSIRRGRRGRPATDAGDTAQPSSDA